MEQWNSAQPSDGITFDHVIRWKIKNIKVQLSQRLQSLNVRHIINHKWNGIHIRMKHYQLYKSCDLIRWSFHIQLPNLEGMHTRIRGYHSFISPDLIMLGQSIWAIKLQPLNLPWWKVVIPTGQMIFDYVISW